MQLTLIAILHYFHINFKSFYFLLHFILIFFKDLNFIVVIELISPSFNFLITIFQYFNFIVFKPICPIHINIIFITLLIYLTNFSLFPIFFTTLRFFHFKLSNFILTK